jgi:hypothetical protein
LDEGMGKMDWLADRPADWKRMGGCQFSHLLEMLANQAILKSSESEIQLYWMAMCFAQS